MKDEKINAANTFQNANQHWNIKIGKNANKTVKTT